MTPSPYGGNPGNANSSSFNGSFDDDNNGNGWCFDLDSDQACDPGSELVSTEEFILSW